ncbi:MAG: hypothetical protein ACP5I1_02450 [Candidatus Hinthialibacter sp.]
MTKISSSLSIRRKSRFISMLMSAVCLICSIIASGEDQPSEDPPASEFEKYSILMERNIFNPNRQGPSAPKIVQVVAPKIDQFFLVGTMIDETNAYAFFEGAESAFNSVCQIGSVIAGHKIEEIRSDGVTLIANEQPIQIAVGKGMMRKDQGAWEIISETPRARQRAPSSSSDQEAQIVSSDKASPPETQSNTTNDILKKLMEKRRQELNQ